LFRLIQSNSIETLAAALAEQLLANTPEDPFAAQKVLVSTNAMGRWLALALSEQLGICAGIDFDFGGRYLRNLVRQLAAQPSVISLIRGNQNSCAGTWPKCCPNFQVASTGQTIHN
jgi:exonuclease V gamma subunit